MYLIYTNISRVVFSRVPVYLHGQEKIILMHD